MYEVWVNELNPALHLVKKPGTPLPVANAMVPWSLLGSAAVTPDVAEIVELQGVAEVVAVVPFNPKAVFGPSGTLAGAQHDIPT